MGTHPILTPDMDSPHTAGITITHTTADTTPTHTDLLTMTTHTDQPTTTIQDTSLSLMTHCHIPTDLPTMTTHTTADMVATEDTHTTADMELMEPTDTHMADTSGENPAASSDQRRWRTNYVCMSSMRVS